MVSQAKLTIEIHNSFDRNVFGVLQKCFQEQYDDDE